MNKKKIKKKDNIINFPSKLSSIDKEIEALLTTDLYTDILENMNVKTNDHIKYNFYARMRIDDHINDIKMLRGKLGDIFTN